MDLPNRMFPQSLGERKADCPSALRPAPISEMIRGVKVWGSIPYILRQEEGNRE